MRRLLVLAIAIVISIYSYGQFSLTLPGTYSETFITLANTGTSSTLPTGWAFNESGSGNDGLYNAGDGSVATGNTYSFGLAANTDRALGGLQSGTLNPTYGFYFQNNTGSTITSLTIGYIGEQWRLGALSRVDRIDFQYSQNATALNNGTWVDYDALDFTAPTTTGIIGALDGNQAANRTSISQVINGILIPNGGTFFIRWTDFNPSGADDGLGVDDFSLIAGFVPSSTLYFRSAQTGNWGLTSTWETSPDGISSWVAATTVPDTAAATVTVRTGHTVSFASFLPIDQVVIEPLGTLSYNTGVMTINDGTGDDIDIQAGGAFTLAVANTPPAFNGTAPTVNVQSAGILRVSAAGLTTTAGGGVHANNYVYQDQSILEYTLTTAFGSAGITYFPNAGANIPIFRTTQTIPLAVGSTSATVINGILEANGNIIFGSSGTKTFRNGIRGTGNISESSSGKFIINGSTAELGGTGSLTVPASGGLEIGTGTTVTLSAAKTVTGNISLLANSYVQLGTFDLTVTGTISGGSATSYIRTNGTGALKMAGISSLRAVPVGNSTYNPLTINQPSGYDWSVRVEDVLTVDDPIFASNVAKAVLREWHITPSVNPPASGADIVFQWDETAVGTQVGASYSTSENLQVWHEVAGGSPWGNDWIAAGVAQVPGGVSGAVTASITGWTQFSPFAISNISGPLPLKLISFTAERYGTSSARLWWEMVACCIPGARFELEKSYDARNFRLVTTINGTTTARFYSALDPISQQANQYYRLKLVDADGTVSYSRIVVIAGGNQDQLVTSVFPNPCTSMVNLSVTTATGTNASVELVNLQGIVLSKRDIRLEAGGTIVPIHTNNLAPGLYLIRTCTEVRQTVTVFSKQ